MPTEQNISIDTSLIPFLNYTSTITYDDSVSFPNYLFFSNDSSETVSLRENSDQRDCNCRDCRSKRDHKYKKAMKSHKSKNNNRITVLI